jgi:hypothetical protein
MSTFTKDIPAVSQSYEFQQWLRQNPDKAARALQFRESVVMEFLRAQKLSPTFDPNVYQAISNGFVPSTARSANIQTDVPIVPVIPVAIPVACMFNPPYTEQQTTVGPGDGSDPEQFDFTPSSGNSVYIRLDPLDPNNSNIPASEVIFNFTGFSDSALVYIRSPGAPEYSTDVHDYDLVNPEAEPFGPYQSFLTGGDIYPHMFYYDPELDDYFPRVPQVIDYVVYHKGVAPTLLFSFNIQCSGA